MSEYESGLIDFLKLCKIYALDSIEDLRNIELKLEELIRLLEKEKRYELASTLEGELIVYKEKKEVFNKSLIRIKNELVKKEKLNE